ncbi:MAG: hypothetical protein ACI8RD_014762, partial [Bacillariaceae sp.]
AVVVVVVVESDSMNRPKHVVRYPEPQPTSKIFRISFSFLLLLVVLLLLIILYVSINDGNISSNAYACLK